MSKFFSLIKINAAKHCQKKGKSLPNVKKSCPFLTALFIIMSVFFGLVYIVKINQSLSYGLKLSNLEKKVETVRKENKNLETAILNLQSVQKVREESAKFKMVQVNEIKYYNQDKNGVALNK